MPSAPGWGGSDVRRAVLRVVIGGALGLAFTHGIGLLFGTAIHYWAARRPLGGAGSIPALN